MHTPINNNFEQPIDYYQLKLEELEEIENAPDPEYLIGSIEEGNAFPISKNGITVNLSYGYLGKASVSNDALKPTQSKGFTLGMGCLLGNFP
jgi:hypothetical protein